MLKGIAKVGAECLPEDQPDLIKLAERKIRELSAINSVSEAVNSTLELDRLLTIALEQSIATVEADAGSLMLINEETGRLEIVASKGIARKWVERTSQEVGLSVAGWVAQNGESVLVTDPRTDTRFTMNSIREDLTSAASVPLKVKDQVIGVLNVNTAHSDRMFDERDVALLSTVANQLAIAIENARLYARVQRRTKQLDSLLQVSRTVTSTLNLDEVLRRLAEEMLALFQLDAAVLLLVDDQYSRLRFGYGTGLKSRRRYAYFDVAVPFASRVRKTGRRVVLKDINASRGLMTEVARSEGLRAAMAFPLKHHNKIVGVAVGFSRETRVFPKSQEVMMRSLGELAGIAIRHAKVYRQKYRIAELLQQKLIPSSLPVVEGLDIGHKFLPAKEVGGDYYDIIQVGPRQVGVALGDVSGNDVDAAEYTTMGKYILRSYAREFVSPGVVMAKTNDMLCEDTRADMFISLFYGMIDLDRMKLRFANGGCEPPVLCKPRERKCHILKSDGMLMGIRRGVEFAEQELDIEPGDVLVSFTDGLTEAGVGADRFGADRIAEVILKNCHLPAQTIVNHIHDALIEFCHGRIADDAAMVVIKLL